MKKKIILSTAFVVSLFPMLLNPIGIISVVLFEVGVWMPLKKPILNKTLGAMGTIGMVVSEIYKFFTWHVMTITGNISFQNSVMLAFPEFYVGLVVSLAMVVAYFIIDKKVNDAIPVEAVTE